jgi:hypothetical protein
MNPEDKLRTFTDAAIQIANSLPKKKAVFYHWWWNSQRFLLKESKAIFLK